MKLPFWLTQFRCAMLGSHAISKNVEDYIFEVQKNRKITVYCKWCNISMNAEIINDSEYKLKWNNYD